MTVRCLTNRQCFNSLKEAAEWAKQETGKCITGINILRSCCGIQKTAAGMFWALDLDQNEIPVYVLIDDVEAKADIARKAEEELSYAINHLYEVLG